VYWQGKFADIGLTFLRVENGNARVSRLASMPDAGKATDRHTASPIRLTPFSDAPPEFGRYTGTPFPCRVQDYPMTIFGIMMLSRRCYEESVLQAFPR
jgi:hypothetical protein